MAGLGQEQLVAVGPSMRYKFRWRRLSIFFEECSRRRWLVFVVPRLVAVEVVSRPVAVVPRSVGLVEVEPKPVGPVVVVPRPVGPVVVEPRLVVAEPVVVVPRSVEPVVVEPKLVVAAAEERKDKQLVDQLLLVAAAVAVVVGAFFES